MEKSPANHQSIFNQVLGNTFVAAIMNFTVWFAITFFAYLETQSVLVTGVLSGLYLVATAGTGIWFGSLVDHHKKKTMMLISSTASLIAYIISFAIYLLAPENTFKDVSNPLLWTFIVTLMAGVLAGNIRNIALPTLVTVLVPEDARDKANGLVGTVTGMSFLVTSVISGVLVGTSGMFWVLALAVSLTVAVIAHLWFINIPERGIAHIEGHEDQPKKVDIKGTIKVIRSIPGLVALILFTTFNNFLGGVFMALMDAYGLSLVSVEVWGFLWGVLSLGFIVGGLLIAKKGLGKNPLRTLMITNVILWAISSVFTIQASIILLVIGIFIYMCLVPFAEAAEQTILQKVVPVERQGRVFGFAQSVEQAASPLTAFMIGPITQLFLIPFMTEGGTGAQLIGGWFGTGANRGMAIAFTVAGIIGLIVTLIAFGSKYYRQLSDFYANSKQSVKSQVPAEAEQQIM